MNKEMKELIEKLHSMRYTKKEVQGNTSPNDKQFMYGYTECINELLIWANKQPEITDEVVIIPKWQMANIEDTLRMANNIHHSGNKETCFDRCVCKAWGFARKALKMDEG